MEWTGLNELREKFLSFYESKGHLRLPSFPLVPQEDKSLLLINSGMAPMKKFFTGEVTPPRKRVTTCQKCIRTPDIDVYKRQILIVAVAAVFVFHLHRHDVPPVGGQPGRHMAEQLLVISPHLLEKQRIVAPQPHVPIGQQPGGQPSHGPLRADVGPRPQDDHQPCLLYTSRCV